MLVNVQKIMRLLKNSASQSQKTLSLLLLAGFVSTFCAFIFNQSPSTLIKTYWIIPTAILTYILTITALRGKKAQENLSKHPPRSRAILKFCYFCIAFLVSSATSIHTLPYIGTSLFGENHTFTSILESKKQGDGKLCRSAISIKEYGYGLKSYICRVSPEVWANVNIGDEITIVGKKSIFGINVNHVGIKRLTLIRPSAVKSKNMTKRSGLEM